MTRSNASGEIGVACRRAGVPVLLEAGGTHHRPRGMSVHHLDPIDLAPPVAQCDLHHDPDEGIQVRVAVENRVHAARELECVGVAQSGGPEVLESDTPAQ